MIAANGVRASRAGPRPAPKRPPRRPRQAALPRPARRGLTVSPRAKRCTSPAAPVASHTWCATLTTSGNLAPQGVGELGIVENQLGQLIYREPLHRRRELQYLAGQRFFQKGDPHAASDHPLAPAAHERSQVAIAIALTAECIERLYRLRQNRPIGLYGASDFERIVAKRS